MFCCNVFNAELFPTPLRQIAGNYSTGIATLISLSGPYIGGSLVKKECLLVAINTLTPHTSGIEIDMKSTRWKHE